MNISVEVKNLKETNKLAKKFAKQLMGGEVVLLFGDLGSGKTTFTKSVLKHLGFKGFVTSPTFTIMQEYKTKKFTINHFDMYRLNSENEILNFGMDENLYEHNKNRLTFIEWPEKIQSLIKGNFIVVEITKIDDNARRFEINSKSIE